MGMVVQHNMNAINSYNRLNANVAGLKKASEKLSSGYRINKAGDDAAGLAISEKMRSQIKGLNQAVRNSQDGINMIQTFEGAAQETHSILQRMKELASESANGTYDNATDRAAIQLEFDQLNDELNQIADTDFNGTVVLNGGVMADGLVAKNGEFNYKENNTSAAVDSAKDVTTYKNPNGTTEAAGKIVDNSKYNKTDADTIWEKLGLDVSKTTDVKVTFTYDGKNWLATSAETNDGSKVSKNDLNKLTTTAVNENGGATGHGGFTVDGTSVNAIFDASASKIYDHLTIDFTNVDAKTIAPANNGIMESSITATATNTTGAKWTKDNIDGGVKFELDSGITDGAMTDELQKALKDLAAAEITYTYTAGDAGTFTEVGAANTADKVHIDTNGNVFYGAGETKLGTLTVGDVVKNQPATPATAASATLSKVGAGDVGNATATYNGTTDGTAYYNTADSKWYSNAGLTTEIAGGVAGLTITPGTATGAIKVDYKAAKDAQDAGTVVNADATGTVKFKVNTDAFNFVDTTKVSATSIATPESGKPDKGVFGAGVSVSDSYGNSTAILTYTDNITLQTGARTKDSVNFSFKYNVDGTADMGDLIPNLDLSSRANGLNTANLNLANQKDANYAIDQIDKAINKTSMVRATFGSIQNRLEHKITNLTTTSENLTEAESSIRDTDMASEMMNYTKFNILQQAAQSMLAQANQQPQSILQLLG